MVCLVFWPNFLFGGELALEPLLRRAHLDLRSHSFP